MKWTLARIAARASGNNHLSGGNGNDVLSAGDGNNVLDGGKGDDTITAGNGNNTVSGGNGNDTITPGNGNNTVTGGDGSEVVTAGNGNNSITGGNGNDAITAGNGNNILTEGNGNDIFLSAPATTRSPAATGMTPSRPLQKLGGWAAFRPEARYVVFQTLRDYPLDHLKLAIGHTVEQFVSLRSGNGFNSENNAHAEWKLSELAPGSMPRFRAAGQQHNRSEFDAINRVQVPLALLAIAFLPVLAWRRRAETSGIGVLALTGFIALAANAAICGIFSGLANRYQSRLAPIATLIVLTAAIETLQRRAGRAPRLALTPD